jgi:hypothetical protein
VLIGSCVTFIVGILASALIGERANVKAAEAVTE